MPAQPNLSSLPPAEEVGGKETDLARVGMGTVEQTGQYGCPRSDKGTLSSAGRVHEGVSRDGAAVVSYANKELAIYHLISCGVMKHKHLPSPVFSAPGRGNMILHIKTATHENFQRKGLYVPKPWRPVDQYAA